MTVTVPENPVGLFEDRLAAYGEREALWFRGAGHSYRALVERRDAWVSELAALGVVRGTVCACIGDYWPEVVAFTLALVHMGAIVVPFSLGAATEMANLMRVARVERVFRFTADGEWTTERLEHDGPHPLVTSFRETGHPGLIVFSSGSTGEPKGILHDFEKLLAKFVDARRPQRTLLFLLLDHLGGINTLLGVLSNGGTGVTAERRTVESVCEAIEGARVELLPVSPTFLALLVLSHATAQRDLSSVTTVTYGTEAMPPQTLQRAVGALPHARFQQTYGLSEVGVLRSKSAGSDSLLVRVGGAGFETKIVDNVLWIRSVSAMVGYLNAPSPFDADGWLNTGDVVEVEGEFLRILGRTSEIINVGGQKVFPAEVEDTLLRAGNVIDAAVSGQAHPLMGAIVTARVTLEAPEDPAALRKRLRAYCLAHLASFKVPVKFTIAEGDLHNARFKKIRRADA